MDFRKILEDNKWLIVLFVLALIIRILFVFSMPVKLWDETVYANLGYDLSKNPLDYSFANNGWSDFIPSGGDNFYTWPKAGFRAPLLPYSLSLLYLFKLDFLVSLFLPIIGAISLIFIYILAKKLFNERVAFISALIFIFIPIHVVYSSKIQTDVFATFFIILTFISFWKGYEENNTKHKLLFGLFLALSLLARYTVLWIAPIFLIYFLIRDKSLKFLKDKYLWYSVLVFFIVLAPWFIYGFFEYGNPIGQFIHGFKASTYWGGTQPWNFFFIYGWKIFSIIGISFLASIIYISYKTEFYKKKVYLLLIWALFFLLMAMLMPHKEERFILPIIPAVCILTGYCLGKIKNKTWSFIITFLIVAILSFSLYSQYTGTFKQFHKADNLCFLEGNIFLNSLDKNSLIITDESSIVYYYTKTQTGFYPNPWGLEYLRNKIDNNFQDRKTYILFSDFDMPLNDEEHIQINRDLNNNFDKIFECKKDDSFTIIYEYSNSK